MKKEVVEKAECKICGFISSPLLKNKILNKYPIQYFKCKNCNFIQTEKPFWLNEAYSSPINIEDTGIIQRNILTAMQITPFLLTFDRAIKLVDFGGGYGLFTRIMRDLGFDYYWEDPFCENLTARGFEAKKNNYFDILTGFELFEHVENPSELVSKLLQKADYIIFTTQTSDKISDFKNWWYMGYSHGQHVSIYTKKSIKILAQNNGALSYSVDDSLHVISKKPLNILQKILLKRISLLFFPLVFIFRKSKTFADHENLKKLR